MSRNPMPSVCPSCGGALRVSKLSCGTCSTEVSGDFELCPACMLQGEHRELLALFLASRGNLKEVQRVLGVSYPTARQRIQDLFRHLGHRPAPPAPQAVLKRLRDGEIDVEEAERLLRG